MNSDESFECTSSGPAALSRRSAVLRLGSGGLAALLAGSVIPIVAAQEASPMAGTSDAGRAYLVTRQYQLGSGHTIEELAAVVESGFLPILRSWSPASWSTSWSRRRRV